MLYLDFFIDKQKCLEFSRKLSKIIIKALKDENNNKKSIEEIIHFDNQIWINEIDNLLFEYDKYIDDDYRDIDLIYHVLMVCEYLLPNKYWVLLLRLNAEEYFSPAIGIGGWEREETIEADEYIRETFDMMTLKQQKFLSDLLKDCGYKLNGSVIIRKEEASLLIKVLSQNPIISDEMVSEFKFIKTDEYNKKIREYISPKQIIYLESIIEGRYIIPNVNEITKSDATIIIENIKNNNNKINDIMIEKYNIEDIRIYKAEYFNNNSENLSEYIENNRYITEKQQEYILSLAQNKYFIPEVDVILREDANIIIDSFKARRFLPENIVKKYEFELYALKNFGIETYQKIIDKELSHELRFVRDYLKENYSRYFITYNAIGECIIEVVDKNDGVLCAISLINYNKFKVKYFNHFSEWNKQATIVELAELEEALKEINFQAGDLSNLKLSIYELEHLIVYIKRNNKIPLDLYENEYLVIDSIGNNYFGVIKPTRRASIFSNIFKIFSENYDDSTSNINDVYNIIKEKFSSKNNYKKYLDYILKEAKRYLENETEMLIYLKSRKEELGLMFDYKVEKERYLEI